jgi:hypothetical protein
MHLVDTEVGWDDARVWDGSLYVLRGHPSEIEADHFLAAWDDPSTVRLTLVERWPEEEDGDPGTVTASLQLSLYWAYVPGLKASTDIVDGVSGRVVDHRQLRQSGLRDDYGNSLRDRQSWAKNLPVRSA